MKVLSNGDKTPQFSILLVDDRKENLLALEALLESPNYTLVKVQSGRDALRQLLTHNFALILLDVKMPTLNGIQTARAIKQREKSKDIPIIFLTAMTEEEEFLRQGYEAGAVDYIFKPINPHVLRSKVDFFVELYHSKAALRQAHDELEQKVEERTRDLEVARWNAESAERRALLLAKASKTLFESLDHELALKGLATLLVSEFADSCAVDLLDDNAGMVRIAFEHEEDPAKTMSPTDDSQQSGRIQVLKTGAGQLYLDGEKSCLCVPLLSRGQILGVLTLVRAENSGNYDANDLRFAEELASRAANAVDNAWLYKEAENANRLKDEFLAVVSHELRTPLTSILGWGELLRSGRLDEQTSERAIETIERNAKNQAHIVEELLDVSRIITGKLALDETLIDAGQFVQNAVDSIRPSAEAKEIRIETALSDNAGLVSGDSSRLQQVVLNVLSNAVKFTDRGGWIRVALENFGGFVKIEVTDNGKGIRTDFIPHIFERFRQADSTTTRLHGGLGLGLAISKHIIDIHGGKLTVESAGEGKGASFTVLLPIASKERRKFARFENESNAILSIQGTRILLVEDHDDTREMLRMLLAQKEAEVRTAASSTEALKILNEWKPDVLISDIGMPDLSGNALIQKVRHNERHTREFIPAIALTAYASAEDRKQALSSGFQAHLPKPTDPLKLIYTIKNVLARPPR